MGRYCKRIGRIPAWLDWYPCRAGRAGRCGLCIFSAQLTAKKNHKANYDAIRTLNLLAGWTVVGWIVAMVWATAKDDTREMREIPKPAASNPEADEIAREFAEFLKTRRQSLAKVDC